MPQAQHPHGTQPQVVTLQLVRHLADAITSTLDLSTVLQRVTDTGAELCGAAFGAFFYNSVDGDGDSYRLHVLTGADPRAFDGIASPRITRLFEPTFTGGASVRIGDVTQDERFSGLPIGHLPLRSYLSTPVVGRDSRTIGALLFGHPDVDVFTEDAQHLLELVAAHAAVAVENARLYTDSDDARLLAEERAQSLELLQSITSRLAGVFTVDDAIDALAGTLAQHLRTERMGVYRLEGDQLRALRSRPVPLPGSLEPPASDSSLGRRAAWASEVDTQRGPVGPMAAYGVGSNDLAHFTSVPLTAPTASRDALLRHELVTISSREEFLSTYPELAQAVPGVDAVAAVPLRVAGADFGVMALSWRDAQAFSPARRRLLEAVGEQLSSTLERIELFASAAQARAELRRHVAELTEASQTLQRSLLPGELPETETVEVEVRYLPGAENAEVGGDWYDVVVTPSGHVTLVIGDVQGHSFSAAAVMGRVSTALHAYLLEGHPLDVALARVNPIVEQSGLLVTCCLVSLDPVTGEVGTARAGHPVPMFWRGGHAGQMPEEGGGPPLGVDARDALWQVRTGQAEPGDRLVLFTDGLIERSDTDPDDQVAALLAVLGDHGASSLADCADAVVAAMDANRGDDVALLLADYSGVAHDATLAGVSATMRVADLASLSGVRRFAARKLDAWGMAGAEDVTVLLVSELVTNALLHAAGPAKLELAPAGDRVRIRVTDPVDSQGPMLRREDLDAENGRGMMLVDGLSLAWGVEPHGLGKTVWAEVAVG